MDFKFVTFLDDDDLASIKAQDDFDARVAAAETTIGKMVNRLKSGKSVPSDGQEVSTITIKFEADTSALHGALDDVLDHVDEVNSALGGYLDEPAIGDIVSIASGGPDMTVISLCECGTAECAWYDDNGMNIDVFPLAALILDDGE